MPKVKPGFKHYWNEIIQALITTK